MLMGGDPPSDADALLAPLAGEKALLLAVSGGPDSIALMLLAARWSLRAMRRIEVATVDHGLREGSREEAEQVGEWARALGFRRHILRWEGAKPASRVQERAREARYALLATCAREIGEDCAIVTAHHADDQAETILFRLTRGSGVAGLSSMARVSMRDGVRLLRPLLGLRKAELEAIRVAAGHPFFHDPSNENDIFARARLRKLSATLEAQGLDASALLRLGARAAQAEEALAWSAGRALSEATIARDASETRLDARVLREFPRELLQRLLAAEVARLGAPAAIRLERLERAAQTIAQALESGLPARITLGGASIERRAVEIVMRRAPPRRKTRAETGENTENSSADASRLHPA
jgi:tRNA(Ile)-lysidine synthase